MRKDEAMTVLEQCRAMEKSARKQQQSCALCGAGPYSRCELPDDADECPYGCSPER